MISELPPLSEEEKHLLRTTDFRHKVEVRPGVWTEGKSAVVPRLNSYPFDYESISGKRILDVGCWSGGFTFAFEQLGAEAVGLDVQDPEASGFSVLKSLLRAKAEHVRASIYDLSPRKAGKFDYICFQGVHYHLKHPILALERLNALLPVGGAMIGAGTTSDRTILDEIPGAGLGEGARTTSLPLVLFYPDGFLGDKTNWFVPTELALRAWLTRTGFECEWVHTVEGVPVRGQSRSETRFIATKVSGPEPEQPFLDERAMELYEGKS